MQETDVAAAKPDILADPVRVRPRSAEFYSRRKLANDRLAKIDVADTLRVSILDGCEVVLIVRLHQRDSGFHILDLISRTRSQVQVSTEMLALGKVGITTLRQFALPHLPKMSNELAAMVEGYLRAMQVIDPRASLNSSGYAQRICTEFLTRCHILILEARNVQPEWAYTDIGVDLAYASRKINTFHVRKLGGQSNTLYRAASTIKPR